MNQGFVEGDEEGGCELGGVCDCWEIVAGKNGIQGRQQNRCSRVVCHRQTSTKGKCCLHINKTVPRVTSVARLVKNGWLYKVISVSPFRNGGIHSSMAVEHSCRNGSESGFGPEGCGFESRRMLLF